MELPEAVTSVIDEGLEYIYGFGPVFEPTVVLAPEFLKAQVVNLSEQIGFDVDTLTFTLGFFACYPLGMIMNMLPYGPIRHFFSFFMGCFLIQFTIGVQWIHQLITSLAVYFLFLILPRNLASTVVPVFVLVYLVGGHLHRQYINYLGWDLDFTGTQMVLTQKLWMMAYNLKDGELLAKGSDNKAAKKCSKYALVSLPNLLEFLGYAFCFSDVMSGPAYEYSVYRDACTGSHMFTPDGKPRGKTPSSFMPTLKPFVISVICMGLFVVGGGMFPLLDAADPQKNTPAILTDAFLALPWMERFLKMWLGLFFLRFKYYFAWKNAEGANNVWYLGFEGFDEKGNALGWENANNVDIVDFETSSNIQTLSKAWNKKTSLWLTRYVYIRTNGSLLAVYSLSAFWHGFYPGYYLFFLSVPLMTFCERLGRKKISPHFASGKFTLYNLACFCCNSVCAQYMVSSFVVLAGDRAWANWKANYFIGHIMCAVFYAGVSQLPSPKKKEKKI